MPKYKNLTELSAAFKSGELDETYMIIMDKGGNSLRLHQNGPEETEDERYEHCEKLFNRAFGCPLQELMKLAGIPAEWC